MACHFWDCPFLPSRLCCCSLRTLCLTLGWLGVAIRTILCISTAIMINNLDGFHRNFYDILLVFNLVHLLLSLGTNCLLIIGIKKKKPHYMLPHINFGVGETLVLGHLIVGICILLPFIDFDIYLVGLVPAGILFIVFFSYMWLCFVELFKELEDSYYPEDLATKL